MGGKRHELVVELPGVVAGQAAVADDRVGGDPDLPGGGADAVAVGEVLEQGDRLVPGQLRAEEGGPLPLGEPGLAGPAVQESDVLVLAVPATDRQVAQPAFAVVGALLVLATEAGQVGFDLRLM